MNKVKELLFDVVNNRNFKYRISGLVCRKIKVWKEVSHNSIVKYSYKSGTVINIRNFKTGLFISVCYSKSDTKKCFSIYDITNLNEKYQKQNIKLINMVLYTFCGYKSASVSYEYNQLTIKYKVFNKTEFESAVKTAITSPTSPIVLWI